LFTLTQDSDLVKLSWCVRITVHYLSDSLSKRLGASTSRCAKYLPPIANLKAPNAGEFGQLIYNSFLINQRNGLAQNYAGGNF